MIQKRTAFALATVLCLAALLGVASAQAVQEQLKKMETDRAAAVVKGDAAKLDKETSDDYTLINVNGQKSDKAQMMNSIKTGDIKLTSDDLSDMQVRVYGNTAVITGKADVKGTIGGKDASGQILFTRVYVKKGGRWQSVAFQQTKVANP
jgi:ketosteroid isomerase-like protein